MQLYDIVCLANQEFVIEITIGFLTLSMRNSTTPPTIQNVTSTTTTKTTTEKEMRTIGTNQIIIYKINNRIIV